jgi:1,4-alpha-glucan branching enzyme
MPYPITIHYDNQHGFQTPYLWLWYDGSKIETNLKPTGQDSFGVIYQLTTNRPDFRFKFKEGPGMEGPWEDSGLDRHYSPIQLAGSTLTPGEIWCKSSNAFVYHVEPEQPQQQTAEQFLGTLSFKPGMYIPGTGGFSGLGAHVLADGRMLFGLYHPNAARVHLMGSFNNWQRPNADQPDPSQFIEMQLYQGYFGVPNTWLVVTDNAKPGDEYKFFVQGGVPRDHKNRYERYVIDPYARHLSSDFKFNNPVIVDPTTFKWNDTDWTTPHLNQLILYELSVHGFTEGDNDIDPNNRGSFRGITERINKGYFDDLGVTALSLMPLAETPSIQGPDTLGYNPSLYFTIERDFGSPDDLRELINAAHQRGIAVLMDQVFNHTDNSFNPLWQTILEHPDEEARNEGGLYFAGSTPWGNRIDTDKQDVQNMLIDACKMAIREYHVDGFRFDATHTDYMNHHLFQRLADEVKGYKPDCILVAENLPNQPDLNLHGFDGYAQWCDQFHDKVKAMLREGPFGDEDPSPNKLGDAFFFSKQDYALHTNNVINYCESHDENSVPFEVATNPVLNQPPAKERKARLGMFSTMVSLGQPMLYMGQEFDVDRPRNVVTVPWPDDLQQHGYYQWSHRLIQLRKRYPALKLEGYNPENEGHFNWVMGPWMDGSHGGGQKVVGWRARPNGLANDTVVVMLNFENHDVQVDVDFGIPGKWVKLADIDQVNDIPPLGNNSANSPTTVDTMDGHFAGFDLPSSSGFIYKWEAPAVQ